MQSIYVTLGQGMLFGFIQGHSYVSLMQLQGEGDMEGAHLLPWQSLHRGRVAALDICTDTREVGHALLKTWLYFSVAVCALCALARYRLGPTSQSDHSCHTGCGRGVTGSQSLRAWLHSVLLHPIMEGMWSWGTRKIY